MLAFPPRPIVWQSAASSGMSVTGTTAETALATITIPANAMGSNGRLRITVQFSNTNSGNNKTLRVRFNGIGGTAYLTAIVTTTIAYRAQVEIANRNATNSQVGNAALTGGWSTGAALSSSAVDTTAAVDIVLSGQLANGTDTASVESYLVELYPG